MADHTPTPWHTGSTNHTELVMGFRDNVECVISESDPEIDMPLDEAAANAAFIVKACNSHDALVKAIKAARVELMVLGDPGTSAERVVDLIDAALQEAAR